MIKNKGGNFRLKGDNILNFFFFLNKHTFRDTISQQCFFFPIKKEETDRIDYKVSNIKRDLCAHIFI